MRAPLLPRSEIPNSYLIDHPWQNDLQPPGSYSHAHGAEELRVGGGQGSLVPGTNVHAESKIKLRGLQGQAGSDHGHVTLEFSDMGKGLKREALPSDVLVQIGRIGRKPLTLK